MNLWNRIIKENNLGKAPPAEISKELNKNPEVRKLRLRHHDRSQYINIFAGVSFFLGTGE
jgi:hypothetical protein